MIGGLGSSGKGNNQSNLVECRGLGVGVGEVENQLAWRGRWPWKDKEERDNHIFRGGRNDPVLMGHIVVGPGALPPLGIDVLPWLVGILENECKAFFPPKAKVLIVGRQVENVFAKVDTEGPGAIVVDLNGEGDIGNAVFFFNDGSLRLE